MTGEGASRRPEVPRRSGVLGWLGVLWLVSVPVGAGAATAGFFAPGNTSSLREGMETGFEPVLVVFWAAVVVLVWGGRAVAAIVLVTRRADLARSFLLLLGPGVAVLNDIAAITRSAGMGWVIALAVIDLVLVAAATVLSYHPATNHLVAETLRERARALQPLPAPGDGPQKWGAADAADAPAVARAGTAVNAYAVVALAMAFAFPMLGPVFGVTARNQIRYSGEQGAGLALAGILVPLGLLTLAALLFITVLLLGPNTTP